VLYISTSDAVLGTLVGTGNNWQVTYSLNATLTPGVTNYLHIVATDSGAPAGFLGEFALSDNSFQFANGTQNLLTSTADWNVSTTGFGGSYATGIDLGANGVGPWGTRPNIDANAHWIWEPVACGSCTVFFETAITSNVSATPEPGTPVLLAAGLALLWRRRARKSGSNAI
jgi:PEP-CTERM motif